MATQQDVQDLLRLLVSTRKTPMLQAMAQVKSLQGQGLRSIRQVAEAELALVEQAVPDAKSARALHNACKAVVKRGDLAGAADAGGKRTAAADGTAGDDGAAKRPRVGRGDGSLFSLPAEMTPQELEESLELPVDTDEARIAAATVECNRAPLLLAFAVELLRYTMPEQPPSSRLSLAQAVVATNSRSKAASLGMERAPPADREGWGEGQPKVRVMGREVSVLKRGGYEWTGQETVKQPDEARQDAFAIMMQGDTHGPARAEAGASRPGPKPVTWSTSQSVSLKESTFVARATSMTSIYDRKRLLASLMDKYPALKTATHNAWAYRVRQSGSNSSSRVTEDSFDDGETGCGKLMLEVMRESDAADTLVVLSRWFGGIMLGPDRWRLMRNVTQGALAERMRLAGAEAGLGGEAVWGLDLEAMRSKATAGGSGRHETTVVGMQVHRPEAARSYLLKSFAAARDDEVEAAQEDSKGKAVKKKHKTAKAVELEKEENLALLLGALRLLFDSWADHLSAAELDRRAWSWYTAVRPEVDAGPSGWGAKGVLRLQNILALRRPSSH